MCGVAGFWEQEPGIGSRDSEAARHALAVATSMAAALAHRGPDDAGAWIDEQGELALAHRRLSIIDLSPLGHQPMVSSDGRYVVAYNGEVYNFEAIRLGLEARKAPFRGTSDTEVVLHAVMEYGLVEAVSRMNGMFAFALFDRKHRELHLVRDRLGEKPLYWGWMGKTLLFGSEIKALVRHPAWRGEIDRDALSLFLRYQYVPTPYSIYRGVGKLRPGTIATFRGDAPGVSPQVHSYWSVERAVDEGLAHPFLGSAEDAVEELDALLRCVVSDEMTSDVPLGAFLSGGVDSSLIVALMQAQSSRPSRTFTVGFRDESFNEARHAAAVARHLQTDHTELYVTSEEMLAVVPRLPEIYDEPFADSSQVPTVLVSEMARRHVTVSLSGDGGDELFAGYARYAGVDRLWRRIQKVPARLRATGRWLDGESVPNSDLAYRARRLSRFLAADSVAEFYHARMAHWQSPTSVARGAARLDTTFDEPVPAALSRSGASSECLLQTMMYLDQRTYLPDDIMTKVDRASMVVSLESRAPFLDHRVVEFAWRLPVDLKYRDGSGKWILKRLVDRYLPRSMMERPKQGFAMPFGAWLRGPLRDWAEALLDERLIAEQGFLEPWPVRRRWEEHLAGTRDWRFPLWDVLMFQAWLERWRPAHEPAISDRADMERYLHESPRNAKTD